MSTDALRNLPIELDFLAMAMEDHAGFSRYWFDTRTGRVEVIPEELSWLDPFDEDDLARIRSEADELLTVLQGIHEGDPRYEPVPQIESREIYRLMARFAADVEDAELGRLLEVALDGRGAFGRFKRVLSEHPDERERWFRMKDEFVAERQREWLSELGIAPAE